MTTRFYTLFTLLILAACLPKPQPRPAAKKPIWEFPLLEICMRCNNLNSLVRDGKIAQQAAIDSFKVLLPLLINNLPETKSMPNVFPVAGYNYKQIGGTNGNGYKPSGYNYFSGNKHSGHPAHDIFIFDKNQDNLDDRTLKPVYLVSATNGVVVATYYGWQAASTLRGGNYAYIFSPTDSTLHYYAHADSVFVSPGAILSAGDTIGTLGRTGLNAYKQRSPTHLHYMVLKFNAKGIPSPINTYNTLVKAK